MHLVDERLRSATGQDSLFWLNRIGALIEKCGRQIEGYEHDPHLKTNDPDVWVGELSTEVWKAMLPRIANAGTDPNLAMSQILSMVLGLFFARIARAKAHDNRRPIEDRQHAIAAAGWYSLYLDQITHSSIRDHEYFPKQGWDDPHLPTATYKPDAAQLSRAGYAKDAIEKMIAEPKKTQPKKPTPKKKPRRKK